MIKLFPLFVVLLIAGCTSSTLNDSHAFHSTAKLVPLQRTSDLRELFCSENELQQMQNKRQCRIFVGRSQNFRSYEVLIKPGEVVTKVLEPLHLDHFGQITIISKNLILQSPWTYTSSDYDSSGSLNPENCSLWPGDLLFIKMGDLP